MTIAERIYEYELKALQALPDHPDSVVLEEEVLDTEEEVILELEHQHLVRR